MPLEVKDILCAVPTRGQVDWNTITRLQTLRDEKGLGPILYEAGRLAVTDVRNRILLKFLTTDAKVLFFVDDDVIPTLDTLGMLDHLNAGYDIVGAPYMMIHPPVCEIPTPCVFQFTGRGYKPLKDVFSLTGLHECDALGTGCMMIQRHVLEDKSVVPFQLGVNGDGVMKMTEDVLFCKRAKERGYKLAADFDRIADHWNSFSLNSVHKGYLRAWGRAVEREEKEKTDREVSRLVTPT